MYHEVITYMHFNNTHDRLRSPDFFFDHTSRYSIESKACHGLSNDIATTKRLYLHIQYTYIIYALKTSIQAVAAELENIRKKPLTRQADDRVGRFSFDKFQDVRAILLRNQLTPVLLLVGLLVRVPRAILLIFLVLLVLLGTGRSSFGFLDSFEGGTAGSGGGCAARSAACSAIRRSLRSFCLCAPS